MGNTMAAARQENDGAKDKRNDMTTKEDNTTATGYHQGTIEMKTEGGWAFPFEMGRGYQETT